MTRGNYYLWGAGTYGSRLIRFMKDKLEFKAVIDNDKKKQGDTFEGLPVISFEQAKAGITGNKIVIAQVYPHIVRNFLLGEGYTEYEDFFSIYDFIPRWFWLHRKKLVPKVVNFVASNYCNLSCDGCQSFIPKLKHPKTATVRELISDVDLLFDSIDSLFLINVCCGESLLNKSLSGFIRHVYEQYRNRYGSLVILTNGTIVPEDLEIKTFAECEAILSISDYTREHPQSRETIEKLVAKCNEFNLMYYLNTSSDKLAWFDFGDPEIVTETADGALKRRFIECFKPGCGIRDGLLFMCQAQNAAVAVAEVPGPEVGDFYDLRQLKTEKTSEDLYRIITRTPRRGYISHCSRCNGSMVK